MASRLPGFIDFTDKPALLMQESQVIVPQRHFSQILKEYLDKYPESQQKFKEITKDFNFTDGIPKHELFIKLADNCTEERATYIANGIRNLFKDNFSILIESRYVKSSLIDLTAFMSFLVSMIGVISLTLAFFYLLVSTSQTINETLREFGCM